MGKRNRCGRSPIAFITLLTKAHFKNAFLGSYHDLEIVVDEFEKPKKMILAEVELPSVDTPFNPPEWLGKEVTGDPSYYNSRI